jgi:hypothetical protein
MTPSTAVTAVVWIVVGAPVAGQCRSWPRLTFRVASVAAKSGEEAADKFLIKTYTRPGETVLDPAIGIGSTGVRFPRIRGLRSAIADIDHLHQRLEDFAMVE